MAGILDRMIRAARLDASLYEEVENDESTLPQALGVVVLSSVAAGIGSSGVAGPVGLVGGTLAALVGWFVMAFLAHYIGTTILAEPQTRSSIGQVLRTTGFAAAPGVIRVLAFIPVLGTLINLVAGLWMIATFTVAVRQALDYTNIGRALVVVILCSIAYLILMGLMALMGMGGLFLVAAR
ncbi:YIP1 family protein [bacterium]|nr:YIP1 family protein [bacterium]